MNLPKRVAALVTEYTYASHADVIIGKILEGYLYDRGEKPNLELASMYVDQFPKHDMSRGLSRKFGFPIYDTIEGALNCGGRQLAVDGVLSIGEQGTYPFNDRGQHLYPRRRFFAEIVQLFEKTSKVVPVFNDKHLSYSWINAQWMMKKARDLRMPFMAGSSLPLTFRRHALQLPRGCPLVEAVQIAYDGREANGFHALEALQCMVERRRGGESGLKSVRALEGKAMWKAFDAGGWSRELLEAALAMIPQHRDGDYRVLTANPRSGAALYFLEYRDGFRAVVALLDGWIHDSSREGDAFVFAGRLKEKSEPLVTQFYLQQPFPYIHFAYLLRAIEFMMHTGRPAYPVERTLLTTGALEAAMTSLFENGKCLDTPHLAITYQPNDWPFATDPVPKAVQRRG